MIFYGKEQNPEQIKKFAFSAPIFSHALVVVETFYAAIHYLLITSVVINIF